MTIGLQEALALLIVALIMGAFIFRRIRARRRRMRADEASVGVDEVGRRR